MQPGNELEMQLRLSTVPKMTMHMRRDKTIIICIVNLGVNSHYYRDIEKFVHLMYLTILSILYPSLQSKLTLTSHSVSFLKDS